MSGGIGGISAQTLASVAGMVGSICFTIQYLPQAQLNYQRKSIKGFNTTGIIIKLLGACFLTVNAFLIGESIPVICYGLFNVIQHSFFMIQFYLYETNGLNVYYLLWLLFPIVPASLGVLWPESMTATNGIKPLAQILSHLPQLMECARLRTTQGVSLASQHLNFVGGMTGIYMLVVNPPVSATTYLLYINSVFQAVSIYALAVYYGECFGRGGAGLFGGYSWLGASKKDDEVELPVVNKGSPAVQGPDASPTLASPPNHSFRR